MGEDFKEAVTTYKEESHASSESVKSYRNAIQKGIAEGHYSYMEQRWYKTTRCSAVSHWMAKQQRKDHC